MVSGFASQCNKTTKQNPYVGEKNYARNNFFFLQVESLLNNGSVLNNNDTDDFIN